MSGLAHSHERNSSARQHGRSVGEEQCLSTANTNGSVHHIADKFGKAPTSQSRQGISKGAGLETLSADVRRDLINVGKVALKGLRQRALCV